MSTAKRPQLSQPASSATLPPRETARAAGGESPTATAGDLIVRLQHLERENANLHEALTSRIVIEQAKGVLAERYNLALDEAFELLRRTARSRRIRIHTLAGAVIAARRVRGGLQVDGKVLRVRPLLASDSRRNGSGDVA